METVIDSFERTSELYDRGLYLQAYRSGEALGPLPSWEGADARLLAAGIARNVGGHRLGNAITLATARRFPDHSRVRWSLEHTILGRSGTFRAWERMASWPDVENGDEPADLRADWLSLRARILGILRDFPRAHDALDAALELAPEEPWTHVELASLLRMEDRYEDSLASAERSLALRPFYRPAVQSAADSLVLLGRDDDALALLAEADRHIESHLVVARLIHLQLELERHDGIEELVERYLALTPLREKRLDEWLAGIRSDLAQAQGDRARSISWARQAGDGFYAKVAEIMEAAPEDTRTVRLPVGFVRQHHMTCAPATLATLGEYWGRTDDHEQIAEEICYDGTSVFRERDWAQRQGTVVREFRVTWDAARALLDRGIPFALNTVEPDSGHLQAIIGYDEARGTLLIRDPGNRESHELRAEDGLASWKAHGPRGMVVVPADQAYRLDGLELPDAELFDGYFEVLRALEVHDLDAAEAAVASLERAAPGHRLTWKAHGSCAAYTGDRKRSLEAGDRLVEMFPEDHTLALVRVGYMRDLVPRSRMVEVLQAACVAERTHPGYWRQYGQLLSNDARTHPESERWLRRAMARGGVDGVGWYMLANLWWRSDRRQQALHAYRIAACLAETDEDLAMAYFTASRSLGCPQLGLEFLHRRTAGLGGKSPWPAITYARALARLSRYDEAMTVLEAARGRPHRDAFIELELSERHALNDDDAAARELLEAARGRVPAASFARTEALVAGRSWAREAQAAAWRRVLELQPLAIDAVRNVADSVARQQDSAAAIEWVRARIREWPYCAGLQVHLAERLTDEDPEGAIAALRRATEIDDADAWVSREICDRLTRLEKFDEALAEAEIARAIEPFNPAFYSVYGNTCERAGRTADARAAFEQAVRLAADTEFAIDRLCGSHAPDDERLAGCRFVQAEIERQGCSGDGLLTWVRHAREVLPATEVRDILDGLWARRPEQWQTWSTLVGQLLVEETREHDRALELARQASERFTLTPVVWVDLAAVHRARGDRAAETLALERAHELSPRWSRVLQELGTAYEEAGAHERGIAMFTAAIQREPDVAGHHGWLADCYWRSGDHERALESIQRALEFDADYPWAWSSLAQWAEEVGKPEVAVQAARAATERVPDEVQAWIWLGRILEGEETVAERLAAYDRAIALDPRNVRPHDLRATLLDEVGRHEEALAACRPEVFGDERPVELRGREAWLLGRQGEKKQALELLESALAEAPDYYWGWQQCSDMREQIGDNAGALAAAEEMVRLAPEEELAYGYRGHAHRLLDQWDEAEADFARAFELEPDYTFPGYALFDRRLAKGDREGARAVLEVMLRSKVDEYKLCRQAQIEAASGNRDAALAALETMLADFDPNTTVTRMAVDAITKAGWAGELTAVAREVALREGSTRRAGKTWIESLTRSGQWQVARTALGSFQTACPAWAGAADAYLHAVVDSKDRGTLREFVDTWRPRLEADTQLWGLTTWAMLNLRHWRDATAWMHDWRRREGVQPWMLLNLSIAHRCLSEWDDALVVGLSALDLPGDHTTTQVQAWAAHDLAIAGRLAQARNLVAALEESERESLDDYLLELTRATLAAHEGDAPEARAALERAWKGKPESFEREERDAYLRAGRVVARASGGLAGLWLRLRGLVRARR